ncbi:FecR domain-containing protein, partial [Streptococcus agalactiae]
ALSVGLLARAGLLPWSLPGDLQTGTAQRRDWQLADGSRLQLNARSRVATAFSTQRRDLRLYQGELVLELAADPTRTFHLSSQQGLVSASSGRLLLR